MKKNILSVLIIILTIGVLTGCSDKESYFKQSNKEKEITCTLNKTNEDGFEEKNTMLIKTKDNNVISVEETTLEQMDEDSLDMSYGFASMVAISLNEVDGYTVSFEKVGKDTLKSYYKIEYDKLNLEQLKEVTDGNSDNDDLLNSVNMTYDEFKEKNLKEYECK